MQPHVHPWTYTAAEVIKSRPPRWNRRAGNTTTEAKHPTSTQVQTSHHGTHGTHSKSLVRLHLDHAARSAKTRLNSMDWYLEERLTDYLRKGRVREDKAKATRLNTPPCIIRGQVCTPHPSSQPPTPKISSSIRPIPKKIPSPFRPTPKTLPSRTSIHPSQASPLRVRIARYHACPTVPRPLAHLSPPSAPLLRMKKALPSLVAW